MEHAKGQVSGSAAEIYESFFLPALFSEWAARSVARARLEPGQSLLDVACGTGAVAREAKKRISACRVIGLDRNDGMLRVARSRAPDIEFREGRAESLPWDDGTFDAVTCQFGLMFFEDRARALSEMWRVLRRGGTLVIAVWASLEDTPGYAAMVALIQRLFGAEVASELRVPYCLGDRRELLRLLDGAGISAPDIETPTGIARFPSIDAWVHTDVRGWTLADRIDDAEYAVLLKEARTELSRFAPVEEVSFESPAHIAVARK
ncbi:MAG: methyltransferase domain-containing protein [Myxococcales bacterium]|nr:methyltransferase domain-containing protein [Myxococcales bacterium]MCB9579513.1 methyltransferase domain-containing protein [Polyangiaceae bacterium]